MWFWFFCISMLINTFALLYIRWLLKIVEDINVQMLDINSLIDQFSDHLKSVYELEMFYGDDTLKGLMDHASQLSVSLKELDLVINEEESEEGDDTTVQEKET